MRSVCVALLALIATSAAPAGERLAIKAGRIYTVSGEAIDGGVILIEDGKIADVRRGAEAPDGWTVIEAAVVIPGLIDAFSTMPDQGADARETIAPDVRAVDGMDFYAKNRDILAGGVTTIGVFPGTRRLVGGQGAVVKLGGSARVVMESFGLRIAVGDPTKNPPAIYEPPILPSADNPIQPAEKQYPTSRMGAFAELRRAFTKPSSPVLREVLAGKRPLVVTADLADDIVKCAMLAEELGARIVVADAREAFKLVDFLAERKIPVVLEGGIVPGRPATFEEPLPLLDGERDGGAAAALAKGGVRFALHAPADRDMRDLLVTAGIAVRHGLPQDAALRAITLAAADILGVADRVGSIDKGKDADLVLLTGDPFAAATAVKQVLIDGETAFLANEADIQTYRFVSADSSRKSKEILAVRAGRILTVSQGLIRDGLILMEDGKITYVGRVRTPPPGAKIIHEPDGVVVPGMIDLNSYLGFKPQAGESALRTGQARGAAVPSGWVLPTVKLIDLDADELRDAAAAGVTSIVLAPRGTGTCSVVKLAGPKEGQVVREIAAVKFDVAPGRDAYTALKGQLDRGRKYNDEWEAYERAKKEGKEAPPPKQESTPQTQADPITGTWKGTMEVPDYGMKSNFEAKLKLDGTKVTGTMTAELAGGQEEQVEGTFVNNEVTIIREEQGMRAEIKMQLVGADHLQGQWKVSMQGFEMKGPIEARRTEGGAGRPVAAAPPGKEPKEPKKDDALEPYRPLFRKEIPALVHVASVPAIENALRLFKDDFGLRFVLLGNGEATYATHLLLQKNAPVAFGPNFLIEKRGALINTAEALASSGVPIAFFSEATSGTRFVPVVAAYAVRYGLDPFDALKAVSLNPARFLGLDGRLGSIERGCDGDLVVFTGDPFELTSRVKHVIINGRAVQHK